MDQHKLYPFIGPTVDELKKEIKQLYNKVYKYIVPVLIAATVFLFINPFKYYIFGQDSVPFIGLFTFYQNPLFTFNDGIEMTYFSFLVNSLNTVFHNPIVTEDILMFFGALLATLGIFDLINVLDFKFGRNTSMLGKIVASLFYLYNPFTLSVTWAHIMSWSFLMIAAPFLISFLIDTLYNGGNLKRLLATTILFFFLAPGTSEAFLPFILIIFLIFLLYWLYFFTKALMSHEETIKSHIKKLVYIIIFPLLAFFWNFVPMYNIGLLYTFRISSPSYLFQLFYWESRTTTLMHVLSLLAYSWIYLVPNAYPWIGSLHVIQLVGYSLAYLSPLGAIMFAKSKKVRPMAIAAVIAVIFSTGVNPPFGIINYYLFRLGGPFLILTNAYYFVCQFYVLFLTILIYFLFGLSLSSIPKSESIGKFRKRIYTNIRHLPIYYKPLMALLIIAIVGISSYPFFTNQVYQNTGTNIDELNLNNGALELQTFLKSNYTSPYFYTLLIPTSSLDGATYLSYNNNSTFADSRGLISTLDPYPLIWCNNSLISTILENYLSSGDFSDMAGVMQYFHVKYIIFTWDYPSDIYWMTHSPDGKTYNMTEIYASLVKSFGNPYNFGNYYVFTVQNVTPFLGAIQNPIFVNSSMDNYINFLASLNYSQLPQNQLKLFTEALLASGDEGNSMSVLEYVPQKNYDLPLNGSLLLMDNGSLVSANIIAKHNNSKYLTLKPLIVSEISNKSTYSTNMLFKNSTYYSKSPSTIWFKQNVSLPSLLNITFSMENTTFNNTDYIDLKFGNVIVSVQAINVSQTAGSNNYILALTANFAGKSKPYCWKNIWLPNINGKKIDLSIETFPNYSSLVTVNVPELNYKTSTMFYFGQDNFLCDPGNAQSQYVYGYRMPRSYSIVFDSGNDITKVYNFSILEGYLINYIILEKIKSEPILIQTEPKISIYGNYHITLNNIKSNSYVYFINPTFEKNIIETNNIEVKATYITSEKPFEIYKITGQSNITTIISIIFPGLVDIFFPMSVLEILVLSSVLIYLLISPSIAFTYRKVKKNKKININ